MMDKEFNLLQEPWIAVLDKDGVPREVSLLDVFREAHDFKRLAGELPTQDVALLRLLLAVLYAVFTRCDVHGDDSPLDNEDEALERWREIWQTGRFPMPPLEKYLESHSERFWLFHRETPFYQVAGLDRGTEYAAAKLMGDLSESGNKVRMFAMRSGGAKENLGYAEAARWLVYLNAFDDTSSKPSVRGEGLPSTGAGWLGKLGLVFVDGENLFETLMLNFSLSGQEYNGQATWEKPVKRKERTPITPPETRAELFSLQSRRIELLRKNGAVTGYRLLGGDFFEKENAFFEPMTLWRKDKKKEIFSPLRHNPAKAFWRDFSALAATRDGARRPGVVDWVTKLKINDILDDRVMTFRTASVKYGDKDFFVDDVFADSVSVNAALLTRLGEEWIPRIEDALEKTEACVKKLGDFARDLGRCAGGKGDADSAKERAYHALDKPFRAWLAGIDPVVDSDNMDEKIAAWFDQTKKTVYLLADELLADAGVAALVGRYTTGNNQKTMLFTAPIAHTWFTNSISKILGESSNERGRQTQVSGSLADSAP